ncbi:transcriptional regulator NrdR [Sulfurifustis variabilis]|uniref:Transcriptional repressor NrdR n=1 Tax=Sulfurifustis variabilis TaxID=1675686 RepID=A0A1B4VC35_9GAMM|nr:transcriptional regulator NrdR [Sulfurifustis variabilis]
MRCPFCSADETRVVDSRLAEEGDTVRRRRECEVCGARFTTFERAELRLPAVIKSDGRRETFNEAKLRAGLSRALEKRPVDAEEVEAMLGRIRHKLIGSGEREIASRQIGEWVMEELKDIDPVAYVRFASVYRSFQDVDAFREEVQRLQSEPSAESRRKQLRLLPEEGGPQGEPAKPRGRRPAERKS